MHSSLSTILKFALAAAGSAQASFLSNDLSFGQSEKISPNGRGIPNYFLLGNPNAPEILSNKIILTPPSPGNQRGAAWTEKTVDLRLWTVDLEFRATGPERGGGNLNLWYVKDGQEKVGASSIYTAGKFDGLAIVVDTYGGSGGTIRGFLNDGKTDYNSHHSVDSLAFGHCSYSYRNLGRPSQLKVEHNAGYGLKVSVDNNLCFESPKILLPRNNQLGVSAASAETPDSFEVFKMVVTTDSPQTGSYTSSYGMEATEPSTSSEDIPAEDANTQFSDDPNFVPAEEVDQAKQFQDLHNRLQSVMRHISALQRDLNQYQGKQIARHNEIKGLVTKIPISSSGREIPFEQINQMEKKMLAMDKKLDDILREVQDPKKWNELHSAVREQHNEVFRHLPEKIAMHVPNSGLIVFFLVLFQLVLMGGYMIWKRRMANSPKKYL